MIRILFALFVCMSLVGAFSVSFAEEMNDSLKGMTGDKGAVQEQDFGMCPVMGGKASEEYSYDYEGKTYYFCCPACIEAFKKDPGKYISSSNK